MVLLSVHLIGLVLLSLCTCRMVSAGQGSYPSKHYQLTRCGRGVVSSKNITARLQVSSKGECAMACTREDNCTSFNIQTPSAANNHLRVSCQLATGDTGNCTEMADDPQYDNYQVGPFLYRVAFRSSTFEFTQVTILKVSYSKSFTFSSIVLYMY